uniref:Uncharacterized protein n=1 Tax=Lymantria dispar multicapsid nuclear polyhedrosis virus TaxID=10449 RepID=A0A1B1MQY7_NPVLD|nr:hypothetical protein [Lymantria dispar multiple nucleopolyhedrovirus]
MLDENLTVAFVWFGADGAPVCNNDRFPFWHNIQYHATRYRCTVIYCWSSPTAIERSPFPPDSDSTNVTAVDFRHNWDRSGHIDQLKTIASKIDYMKVQIALNCKTSSCFATTYVLIMDMDCVIDAVDLAEMARQNRYLEPFFDRNVTMLYCSINDHEFDSYIENYATLINRKARFFGRHHHVRVAHEHDTEQNCYIYAQYLNIVHLYYALYHSYTFPERVQDLDYKNCVELRFRRGSSWSEPKKKQACRYKYIYDKTKPPVFAFLALDDQLRAAIRTDKRSVVCDLLLELKRLDYDFKSSFDWCNHQQKLGNVAGVLLDRLPDFDLSSMYDFILPIQYYIKKY